MTIYFGKFVSPKLTSQIMNTTDNPVTQTFHITGIKHISANDAATEITNGNAILIDVREVAEFTFEYIPLPNVFNFPIAEILDQLSEIPVGKPIFVISEHGERSSKIVNLFMRNGLPDSFNIDGGLKAWKQAGLPFEDILPEACSHCTVEQPACSCCVK
jgi:rhodanese-related sulfurtransferase